MSKFRLNPLFVFLCHYFQNNDCFHSAARSKTGHSTAERGGSVLPPFLGPQQAVAEVSSHTQAMSDSLFQGRKRVQSPMAGFFFSPTNYLSNPKQTQKTGGNIWLKKKKVNSKRPWARRGHRPCSWRRILPLSTSERRSLCHHSHSFILSHAEKG